MTPSEFNAIETPRTDAAPSLIKSNHRLVPDSISADEARQLEREVALLERALKEIHLDGFALKHRMIEETLRTLAEIRKGTG